MIIPQFFLDSVVTISNEAKKVIGTGFIAGKKKDTTHVWLYLVTNKHIFDGQKSVWLKFQNTESSQVQDVILNLYQNDEKNYSFHKDPKIDIAAIHINGKYLEEHKLKTGYFDLEEASMSTSEMNDNGVSEGALVYSSGYPLGFINVDSKYPICRLGCIARMCENQVNTTKNILLDIQNFPGSSGSPVILRPEILSITGTKSCSRAVLIGILHSYIPYRENLMSTQSGEIVETRTENSGLANMNPVEFIREVVEEEYNKKNKWELETILQLEKTQKMEQIEKEKISIKS